MDKSCQRKHSLKTDTRRFDQKSIKSVKSTDLWIAYGTLTDETTACKARYIQHLEPTNNRGSTDKPANPPENDGTRKKKTVPGKHASHAATFDLG